MAQFEDSQGDALQISSELAACLVALGVSSEDETGLRALAREAMAYKPGDAAVAVDDLAGRAKLKFFGLIALMLKTMEESADEGAEVHGSDVWKAVSRALWAEKGAAS